MISTIKGQENRARLAYHHMSSEVQDKPTYFCQTVSSSSWREKNQKKLTKKGKCRVWSVMVHCIQISRPFPGGRRLPLIICIRICSGFLFGIFRTLLFVLYSLGEEQFWYFLKRLALLGKVKNTLFVQIRLWPIFIFSWDLHCFLSFYSNCYLLPSVGLLTHRGVGRSRDWV